MNKCLPWINSVLFLLQLSPAVSLYHHRECTRGGFCNFMHLKPISRELRRELYGRRRKGYKLTHYLYIEAHILYILVVLQPFIVPPSSIPQPSQVSFSIERQAISLKGQRSWRWRWGWRWRWRWPWPRETSLQRQRAFRTILNHKPWLLIPHSLHMFILVFFFSLFSLYPSRSVLGLIEKYMILKLGQHWTCFILISENGFHFIKLNIFT